MNNPRRIQRHLVKALAAGALLAAAALPMAIATAAGAAGTGSITFTEGATTLPGYFGAGSSGTFTLTDTAAPFAANGGTVTVTSNDAGVTFTTTTGTTGSDITGDTITGSFTSTAAAASSSVTVTVVDSSGTETYNGLFSVNADPTVTSITPTSAPDIPTGGVAHAGTEVTVTATGSGFIGAAGDLRSAALVSTVDGTHLNVVSALTSGTEATPSSTATVEFWLQNVVTNGAATPGTYDLTFTNNDGGSVTTGPLFTVIGDEITNASPSSVSAVGTYPITITGGGFEQGAVLSLYASGSTSTACANATLSGTSLASADEFTANLVVTSATTAVCDLYVINSGTGDNGAAFDLAGAIGFGTDASSVAPTITASSLTSGTALTAGAPSTTIVLTGTGFGANNGTLLTEDPALVTTNATLSACVANGAGTSLTCNVAAGNSGTKTGVEGNYTVSVNGGTLADAFSVTGPAITSIAPAALAAGAPIGTAVAITGTGFSNTTGGTVTEGTSPGTDTLAGNFQYVSPTAVNFVVTTPPSIAHDTDALSVTAVDAYGYTVASAPTSLAIDATPVVSSLTYVTGTTGVGIGATAQKIVINGTGFLTGATVGSFVNAAGTADANVTATVTAVTSTSITATLAVKAGDTNTIVGYTVTNTDGGSTKVLAIAPLGIKLDAAPTITAVSPVTATPSSTNAFTITGTGFVTGAVVTPSSDGTCGTATVASATSITVSCTLGAASSTAVTLAVSNPDGGTATSGTILQASAPKPPAFKVTGAHGVAVAGKTSVLTVTGSGFYGQPKITSNAAGTKVTVAKDNGKVLTIHVTTRAGTKAGTHVLTIRLANGKTGRANYSVKG